jgi:hypothetical protein
MPVTTPVNLTYGVVNGKFYSTLIDSNDAGREPDFTASSGTVTFTPAVPNYKNLAIPALIMTTPVTGTIDALGDLRDSQNSLGVYLVASNNVDLVPKDWTYTVTISVTGAAPITFPLLVQGGGTYDLTVVSPAATSAGTAIVVSSADRILAQQAAIAAQASADAAAASAASGGGGGGLNVEQVQDTVGSFLTGSGYVQIVYNDAANTLVASEHSSLTTALAARLRTDTASQGLDSTQQLNARTNITTPSTYQSEITILVTSWGSIPTRSSSIPPGYTGVVTWKAGGAGARTLAGDTAMNAAMNDGDTVEWQRLVPVA